MITTVPQGVNENVQDYLPLKNLISVRILGPEATYSNGYKKGPRDVPRGENNNFQRHAAQEEEDDEFKVVTDSKPVRKQAPQTGPARPQQQPRP